MCDVRVSILIILILSGLTACTQPAGSSNAPTSNPPKVEAQLMDMEVTQERESGGIVVKVSTLDGRLVHKSGPWITFEPSIFKSRGIIAYTYPDHGMTRLRAMNTLGELLPTEAQILDANSQVFISDGIVAFTAEIYSPKSGTSSELTPAGRRVFAYTRKGEALTTPTILLAGANGEKSKIFLSNTLLALTGHSSYQGRFLRDEGTVKVYESQLSPLLLATFTIDGRTLPTATVGMDDQTEIKAYDSGVFMKGATVSGPKGDTHGKVIPNESTVSRASIFFKFDGSTVAR